MALAVVPDVQAYRASFTDWLACATAGAQERAARAVAAIGDDLPTSVAAAGAAGHVLDFDDTLPEGIAHISAATAPAALVLAAHLGRTLQDAIEAYAAGFEAMSALAGAGHPVLYEGGWHPTAVCGPVGAAVAAATLLELDDHKRDVATAIALLRAGSTRGAFGSDGKAIQVGLASAAGVQAAQIASAGGEVGQEALRGKFGFESVYGVKVPEFFTDEPRAAITRNWIKVYPSCLGTHSPIAAASYASAKANVIDPRTNRVEIVVSPVGRQAAHRDSVFDGLSAKFSIPYCVAYTLLIRPPQRHDFDIVDMKARAAASAVKVSLDESLPDFGAVLKVDGQEVARVPYPPGAPQSPVTGEDLQRKIIDLAGHRFDGVLDTPATQAAEVLAAAGLRFGPS